MSKQQDVCPGCSKHCSAGNVRCKYGQKYFEKRAAEAVSEQKTKKVSKRRKWEKHVTCGGLVWKFLWLASQSKRALRQKDLTEQEWLSALDETERAQLDTLLTKISDRLG